MRLALRVARLEALEATRDPQVGVLLALPVLLVYAVLLSDGEPSPLAAAVAGAVIGPLALLFLAVSRRGAAHEAAFRRLVLTCPVTPGEWLLGRFLGLHALGLAYLALLAPAVGPHLASTAQPGVALLRFLAAYAAFTSLLFLGGLALCARGNPRAPLAASLVVVLFLVSARFPYLYGSASGGLATAIAAGVLAAFPPVQALLLGEAAGGAVAPFWAAAPAVAATLALAAAVARWRMDVGGSRLAVAGLALAALIADLALAASIRLPERPTVWEVPATGGAGPIDLAGFLFPVALLPLGLSAWSRWTRRRGAPR